MGSLPHLDTILGELLELLMEASAEIKSIEELDEKRCLKAAGKAITEIWSIRDDVYMVNPNLKRDFVSEYEHDRVRYEALNDLFHQARKMETSGDLDSAKRLYLELRNKSRFGYFRLLAESGLYRLIELNTAKQLNCAWWPCCLYNMEAKFTSGRSA